MLRSFVARRFSNTIFATESLSKVDWDACELPRILVTGAMGQVGSELVPYLRKFVSQNNVVASDITRPDQEDIENGPFFYLDITDKSSLTRIVAEQRIDAIVHLAAILSAKSEENPKLAMKVNEGGLSNILDVTRDYGLKLFIPSSASVFSVNNNESIGDNHVKTPQSLYSIHKENAELLGTYFAKRYADRGVRFISARFPGVISAKTLPSQGTTDWASEALAAAASGANSYTCWMSPDIRFPFIHIKDMCKAVKELLFVQDNRLSLSVYNVNALSFSPSELEESIRRVIPGFTFQYIAGDKRVELARKWPSNLEANNARQDWGWKAECDFDYTVKDIIEAMRNRSNAAKPRPSFANIKKF